MRQLCIIILLIAYTFADISESKQYLQMGETAYKANFYTIALGYFQYAYTLDNKNYSALANENLTYLKLNEYENVIKTAHKFLQKSEAPKSLRANVHFNLAKSLERKENLQEARFHFEQAYKQKPLKLYRTHANSVLSKIDAILLQKVDSLINDSSSSYFQSTFKMLKLDTKFDSTVYGDSVFDYKKIFQLKQEPNFEELAQYVDPMGSCDIFQIDFNNDYRKDYFYFSQGGSGHYTDYHFLQKDNNNRLFIYKRLSGDGFAYYRPHIFTFMGVTYIVDKLYLDALGQPNQKFDMHPDKQTQGDFKGKCLFRMNEFGLVFYSPFIVSYDYLNVEYMNLKNDSLFYELVPYLDETIFIKEESSTTYTGDFDRDGEEESIVVEGRISGGMGDKLRYDVSYFSSLEDSEPKRLFLGNTYSREPSLFHTTVKEHQEAIYLVNFYELKSFAFQNEYQCNIFKLEDGHTVLQASATFKIKRKKVSTKPYRKSNIKQPLTEIKIDMPPLKNEQ